MPMKEKRPYEQPKVVFVEVDIGCQLLTGTGGGSLPPGIEPEPFGSSRPYEERSYSDWWN